MKTPEEMAMEYIKDVETARNPSVAATAFPQMQRCFLAGYKAGCENTQTQLAVGEKTIRELLGKPQWISVKDRLPEDGVGWTMVYGCILSRWSVQPGFYDRQREEWISRFINEYEDEEGYARLESVTHWMPLPEPPKEEG